MYRRHTTLPEGERDDLRTLRGLLPYLWPYRGRALLALASLLLAKLATVGVPLALKEIFDHLEGAQEAAVALPVALFLAYGALRLASSAFNELRDALRGVLDAGLSMHASATAMQVFEAADAAIGMDVLVPLYQNMKADPYPVDLDALWSELGVDIHDDRIVYNDDAPLAEIRKQLLKS